MRASLFHMALCFSFAFPLFASKSPEDLLQEIPKFQMVVQGMKLDDGKNIMDVHVFNRHMKPHAAFFNRCNAALFNEVTYTPKQVLDEMQGLRALHPGLKLPDVSKEIKQLRGYLVKLNLDGETGMQVSGMLSALWNYMKGPIHDDRRNEFIVLLYGKMLENTTQKGGCFPGYAGRLMQVNQFCILSKYMLVMQERERALMYGGLQNNEFGRPQDSGEDDVQVAMLMSLHKHQNNNNNEPDVTEALRISQADMGAKRSQEELDLEKALRLSQIDPIDEDMQLAIRLSQGMSQMEADRLLAEKLSKE